VSDSEARFWSLFGHIAGQGLDCITDFATREHAEEVSGRITCRRYCGLTDSTKRRKPCDSTFQKFIIRILGLPLTRTNERALAPVRVRMVLPSGASPSGSHNPDTTQRGCGGSQAYCAPLRPTSASANSPQRRRGHRLRHT
jgi:hypothetical protein